MFTIVVFPDPLLPVYETVEVDGVKVPELTKGTPVGAMDMLIAATALAHKLTVITNNASEFKRIQGLKVKDWSK